MPISDELREYIRKLKENDPKLTSIDLEYNKIGDDGAQALAEMLTVNHTLTLINLRYNKIGDDGARAVAKMLNVNHTLTSIDLRDNNIGDDGAQALAEMLKVNQALTSINLGDNKIREMGGRALADALKVNCSLDSINLGSVTMFLPNNAIGDNGAQAIAKTLEENHTLTSISLRDNRISDDGAQALIKVLQKNQTLTSICVDSNRMSYTSAEKIVAIVKRNKEDYTRDYPLHAAIKFSPGLFANRETIILELLRKGLDPSSIDNSKRTALQVAQIVGKKGIIEIIHQTLATRNHDEIINKTLAEIQEYKYTGEVLIQKLEKRRRKTIEISGLIENFSNLYKTIAERTGKRDDIALNMSILQDVTVTKNEVNSVENFFKETVRIEEKLKKQLTIASDAADTTRQIITQKLGTLTATTEIEIQAEIITQVFAEIRRLRNITISNLTNAKKSVISVDAKRQTWQKPGNNTQNHDTKTLEEINKQIRQLTEKVDGVQESVHAVSDSVEGVRDQLVQERKKLEEELKQAYAENNAELTAKIKNQLQEHQTQILQVFDNKLQEIKGSQNENHTLLIKLEQMLTEEHLILLSMYKTSLVELKKQLKKMNAEIKRLELERVELANKREEGITEQVQKSLEGINDRITSLAETADEIKTQLMNLAEKASLERENQERQERTLKVLDEKLQERQSVGGRNPEQEALLRDLLAVKNAETLKAQKRAEFFAQEGYPQLKDFYLNIQLLLNRALKADELKATGEFVTRDTTRKEKAASVARIISRFIPLVGTVVDAAGTAVKAYAEKSKQAKAQYVTGLAPDTFAREAMVEEIAFGLCEHYERQLKGLTLSNEIERKTAINRLAEAAVSRLRGYLQKGAALEPDPVTALVRAVRVTKIKKDRKIAITEKPASANGDRASASAASADTPSLWLDHWTAHGFFSQSGIRTTTPRRRRFDAEAQKLKDTNKKHTHYTDVRRYDYANGTAEDARIAGMELRP